MEILPIFDPEAYIKDHAPNPDLIRYQDEQIRRFWREHRAEEKRAQERWAEEQRRIWVEAQRQAFDRERKSKRALQARQRRAKPPPPAGEVRREHRERHRKALLLRLEGKTFREIGEEIGVSKNRAHQIVERAVRENQTLRKRWRLRFRPNLGRPLDMGGQREVWHEFKLGDPIQIGH
jgi:hypothetical protein